MNDRIQHGHDARVPSNFTGNMKIGQNVVDPGQRLVQLAEQQLVILKEHARCASVQAQMLERIAQALENKRAYTAPF